MRKQGSPFQAKDDEVEDRDDENTEAEETVEETVRAVHEELQNGSGDSGEEEQVAEGEDGGAAQEVAPKAEPEKVAQEGEQETEEEDYEPPSRLSPKERKLFNRLPKSMKPAVARLFKEHQSNESRRAEAHSRAVKESERMVEAVRPYYVSQPVFAENGVSESGFISMLVAGHQRLTSDRKLPNGEKEDWVAIERMASQRGYKIQRVDANGEPVRGAQAPAHDPEKEDLRRRLHSVESEISNARAQRTESYAAQVSDEFRKVRAQKGPDGSSAFPEMFDETFWKEASPLALNLIGKGVPAGEAIRRVHYTLTGRYVAPPPTDRSRPASSGNSSPNRSVSANGSVRGGSTVPSLANSETREVGDDETPEESARIALEELQRGFA